MLEEKKAAPAPYLGITTGTSIPTGRGNIFGAQTSPVPEGQIAITNVAPGSTGEEGGLDIGDVLVSMDGDRVDPQEFERRLAEKKIGSTVAMTVMRRDQLRTINVRVGSREKITYSIKEKPDATELQKQIFTSWLGEKKFEP
jgi:predicted metalloprotease with PDZ domain